MNILVTGGAGYLGSTLVPDLLSAGHKVTVLDNFMYDQNSLLDCSHYKNFNIIRGDYRDKKTLQSALSGVDYIIHLAADVGGLFKNMSNKYL